MWDIIGIYRDPMEDILAIERLAVLPNLREI